MKIFFIFALFSLVWCGNGTILSVVYAATNTKTATSTTLKDLIEHRALELQKIQDQRNELEKNLREINKSSNKLTQEIQGINTNINHLQLSIRANTITVQTLSGEIESLGDDIDNIKNEIITKQNTIEKLFGELQQKDSESLFLQFFKNNNLSDTVAEIHAVTQLNTKLVQNINELRNLRNEMAKKLYDTKNKKYVRQQEKISLVSRQQIIEDQKQEKRRLLTETRNQEKVYESQISVLEKLQEEISEEVEKIESELRKGIDPTALPAPSIYQFLWPVPGGYKTQDYGNTKFALRNYKGKHHNGLDIGGVPIGNEVVAAEKGTVINVANQDKFCRKGAYGKLVVIKHTNGLTTLYGHLSKYIVSIGDTVERGEVIGYIGETGYATGPHLHFTVFATQTITPMRPGYPEGTKSSRCGPMPVGGHLNPTLYLLSD